MSDILKWASAHREATGEWPTRHSGSVAGARFENWGSIDGALRHGRRGLPGGSSLAQLLAERLGARNIHSVQSVTEELILQWADAHHQRTGSWPTAKSGPIPRTKENWSAVEIALRVGVRGLPGGSSIARLLADKRGARNRKALPRLTEELILGWADAYHGRTGEWPIASSGPVADAPGETWMAVDMALNKGRRSLPGGSSLALLLADKKKRAEPVDATRADRRADPPVVGRLPPANRQVAQ
jgi:hypothetical protein